MLTRRLEPEVMDTPADAHDYDAMDHSTVNRSFVNDLLTYCHSTPHGSRFSDSKAPLQILDVGTGTALIPIEFCHQFPLLPKGGPGGVAPRFRITALDAAAEMLLLANQNIARRQLADVIRTERVDAKSLPYATASFDIVMSNSIVHHIPEPLSVIEEMSRVLHPGGILFVRDLLRPDSANQVEHIVATYAGQENAHSQQLFRDSLHAALTIAEVQELARHIGMPDQAVQQSSDRHWTLAWSQPG